MFFQDQNGSSIGLWPWLLKKWIFKVIDTKNHVYHLKDLKKLYRRHLNGTYRFLDRNRKNCCSKLWKTCVLVNILVLFSTLSQEFHYFWPEIDMFRLNVFCITFWELSNGIHGFSYQWPWKSTFSKAMVRGLYWIHSGPEKTHFLMLLFLPPGGFWNLTT